MLINWGQDYFDAKAGRYSPIVFDSKNTINGHVLLLGESGAGKSYTILSMISQGASTSIDVRFRVFDVHGDLSVPGASVALFSEQAGFGLNPFKINPDRDFGGVRKCIQQFISTINIASKTPLGLTQESVIRNLLLDVFEDFGFFADDPKSWSINAYDAQLISGGRDNRIYLNVPFEEKSKAQSFGARWDGERKLWYCAIDKYAGELLTWKPAFKERTYPTLKDVIAYARRLHEERFLGSEQKAVRALQVLNKRAQTYQRKLLQSFKLKRADDYEEDADIDMEEARQKAIAAYTDYVNSVQTGQEFDNLIKYDSAEVLKSVLNRLNNLMATGIFKATTAPFDDQCAVWRYKLNPLRNEEKKMLVLFMLQDIFYEVVERGEQKDIVEVIVLDELGTYVSSSDNDNGDGIIGTIIREGRKFGLAIWAANQSPDNVPKSMISSVATKVLLGLDSNHYTQAISKFNIEKKLLEFLAPRSTIAVQMKEKGSLKNRWRWVQLAASK